MEKSFFNFKYRDSKEKGFTLAELIVALGVFLVIMNISLGSIISILDAGRKARSLKSVMTNLNFTVEFLSKELKFGDTYYCGTDTTSPHVQSRSCTGGANPPLSSITFTTSENVDTIYRLTGTQIEKSTDNGQTYIGVTSPEITIQDLKFYVFGTAPFTAPDTEQPRILMIVRGFAGPKQTSQSSFIIQTVISQRGLDS